MNMSASKCKQSVAKCDSEKAKLTYYLPDEKICEFVLDFSDEREYDWEDDWFGRD